MTSKIYRPRRVEKAFQWQLGKNPRRSVVVEYYNRRGTIIRWKRHRKPPRGVTCFFSHWWSLGHDMCGSGGLTFRAPGYF